MSTRVDAVIFDMDGLLLDTERVALAAFLDAAGQLGIDAGIEIFTTLIGKRWRTTIALLEEALGPEDARRLLSRWPEVFDARVQSGGIPKKPGVDDLLGLLHRRQTPIALATSTSRDRTRVQLQSVDLLDHFPVMATGDEVANGKPDPDIFLLAAERLNVRPRACIAIEDSEAGVESAHAAGMRVIMVPDLKQPGPETAALAERVSGSLIEVRQFLDSIL